MTAREAEDHTGGMTTTTAHQIVAPATTFALERMGLAVRTPRGWRITEDAFA